MLQRLFIISLFGVICGCSVALLAVVFVECVSYLNDLLFISPRSRILGSDNQWLPVIAVAVPTVAGLLVGLLVRIIPEKRPHGVPDAIVAAQTLESSMQVRGGLVSAFAAVLSLGAGASVGQYGPLVHLGATIGSWQSRLFGNNAYLGTMGIGCGAAAAIATAFNAPIAGLVFAHEVILRHYSLRTFAPITLAAALGYMFAHVVFDRQPLFLIETGQIGGTYEFVAFVLIGIVGACIAALLLRGVLFSAKVYRLVKLPGPVKTAFAGFAVGIVGLQIPEVLGVGKEVLRFAIIENAFTSSELVTIFVAKLVLTSLCLGFGFVGGVFSPALLIGILYGALVGTFAQSLFGDSVSHIAIYAVCGMVAVTGPVIGAPLTTILIVFELTQNYSLATAAMVSVVFANLVCYRIVGRSLFDAQLKSRGFDLSLGRDKVIVERRKVRDFIEQNYVKATMTSTQLQLRRSLVDNEKSEIYIVNEKDHYIGTVTLNQLLKLEGESVQEHVSTNNERDAINTENRSKDQIQNAATLAKKEDLLLSPDDSVWDAMLKLGDFVGESIPVIDDEKLLGVVFEASIVRAYLKTLNDIRAEENAAV